MTAAIQKNLILVTGGSGQLATALALADPDDVHVIGRPDFDLDHPASMVECLELFAPRLVINTAAWTAVDLAETHPEAAARANVDGPAELARWCEAGQVPLIHISTDYVFDGRKGRPYSEIDATSPTGVYGRTKLAGEQAVLDTCRRAVVARTSWVYSTRGKNFVRTMLAAGQRQPILRIVDDQQGCPTAADDLADALLTIARRVDRGWREAFGGVVHIAGTGATSWFGLAQAVFSQLAERGYPVPLLEAIATSDWPTPAQRPPDSRLACDRLNEIFGLQLPDWQSSVVRTVDRLVADTGAGGAASAD